MARKILPLFGLLIALIATAGAEAQTRRTIALHASVPYEFVIGNRTLPAGTYVFEMATGSPKTTDEAGVLIVHNYERKLYVAVATGVENDIEPHALPKLVFVRHGQRVYLSKVWRQGEVAGLTVHTPANQDSVEESHLITLEATASGGM